VGYSLTAGIFAVKVTSAATETCDVNVIHATGSGNVIGTPDRAQVTFAVATENIDVKIAQQANAARMRRVIDTLVAAGLPRDALKTTGYNIYPVYDDYSKTPFDQKIRTYQVTNTLTVTLHEVNRTGEVIDIAVANGINQASSIQFMLSDEQSQVLRTEALKNGGYTPVLFENYNAGDSVTKSAAPTPIQPGDVTVNAQVSITYSIR